MTSADNPTLPRHHQDIDHHETSTYRADVDGLRAIAILSVVLFHAGTPGFSGGFVGVDIFFVISGYLIGGLLRHDIERGRFSYATFYARRARRILPALFAASIIASFAAILLLSPEELVRFAKSNASALLGISNLRFWRDGDYFAPDAQLDPFLMTWSLGIEEQFYLVAPALMLFVGRWRARVSGFTVAGLTAMSFLLSVRFTASHPIPAFYLLPTRAWELGAGVLLSLLGEQVISPFGRFTEQAAAACGLAFVTMAITMFTDNTPFPGAYAALPVSGTVMLLLSKDSWVNRRLLAAKPMRGIGLISYSWYLWHWLILSFARICSPLPLLIEARMGAILLSLVAAICSWRWVERPFRERIKFNNIKLLIAYAAALVLFLTIPLVIYLADGFPNRLPPASIPTARVIAEGRGGPCLANFGDAAPYEGRACRTTGHRSTIALLGDSHAAALGSALREAVIARHLGFRQYTKSSCPPFFGVTVRIPGYPNHAGQCITYNRHVVPEVLADPDIAIVVLTFFVPDRAQTDNLMMAQGPIRSRYARDDPAFTEERLLETARLLAAAGKRVIILGDVPRFNFDPSRYAYARFMPLRAKLGNMLSSAFAAARGVADDRFVEARGAWAPSVIDDIRKSSAISYISLSSALCDQHTCRFASPTDVPYYVDKQHLSRAGAEYALRRSGIFRLLLGAE